MNCGNCGSPVDGNAKYCGGCGHPIMGQSLIHLFELGKLEALHSVRKEILSWGAGLVAIFSILAFFGLNELVTYRVSQQVGKEIEKQGKTISDNLGQLSARVSETTWEAQEEIVNARSEISSLNSDISVLEEKKKANRGKS